MRCSDLLSNLSGAGFLSPKAARFQILGEDRLVFMGALPYHTDEPGTIAKSGQLSGTIAPFARRNYYRAAVLELKKIVSSLSSTQKVEKKETTIFCNSRLPEKGMAASSGMGVYGKNGLILVPRVGSLCILAGMHVPIQLFQDPGFETTFPLISIDRGIMQESTFPRCRTCTACMSACPTSAITRPGIVDRTLCIQNLTTSTEAIPAEIMEKWGGIIYGCQICQEVCPENLGGTKGFPTRIGEIGRSVPLELFLTGGVDSIRKTVKGTVMDRKWIPPEALLRNALIAAGNSRQPRSRLLIEPFLENSRKFIRETARWAYRKTTSTVS